MIATSSKALLLCLISTAALSQERGSVVLKSGVIFTLLRQGEGRRPIVTDTVKVNYRGTLPDGTEFDSTYKRDQPATFPLPAVIKCFSEGVQRMRRGGKVKVVCPPSTAYGERGHPPAIPANSTLIFEIELLEVVRR